ncbi:alpha-amylase family glycosyl hydrolase [Sphingobacterium wenxiniae]|uniref:1,4-alpha-glucan branching enzyme n=1 Tax=Sphingobacterium wenxiniae TaxID=683125 RepID=A0A1I6TXS3_9SPHI|nr:alpha-amylase family glycosyl hydrolase [Sphingobacterium wenxiniae]SFS93996.1 1,4-alpha-glucan branching enzyme [Sphingobacterium wenxiniae]
MNRSIVVFYLIVLFIGFQACDKKGVTPPGEEIPVPSTLPSGVAEGGVTWDKGSRKATFTLIAPNKKSVNLISSLHDFKPTDANKMHVASDGQTWWLTVENLPTSGHVTYQFLVDGELKVADPYCHLVLDPDHDRYIQGVDFPAYPTGKTNGIVSVLELDAPVYSWKANSFSRPNPYDLVIYELLVRDFVQKHDYKTVQDSIPYFQRLGVNAIQLLPVQEFEGNLSWGYNPSFHLAVDKYYGRANDLKALVDALHEAGIAVILDVVYNHAFGQSPLAQLFFNNAAPTAQNPWLNRAATHPYNVGYDFNHESALTKQFVKDVLKYWVEEFHVDGFRFDLSKGFTQKNSGTSESAVGAWSAYDASRVQIWKEYNDFLKRLDPELYVILEHFGDDQEEQELAEEGMFLWNNLNYVFNEATMGYHNDPKQSSFKRLFKSEHGFAKPNLITYMESHDEERIQYKNQQWGNSAGNYSAKDLPTALQRTEMAAAFLMLSPGPKMIWQFGELGYDIDINHNGRTGEKPILWDYLKDSNRYGLYKQYSKLIHWKRRNTIFRDAAVFEQVEGAVKYFILSEGGQQVMVIGNFGVESNEITITAQMAGTWKDNMTQANKVLATGQKLNLKAGEHYILSSTLLNN